MHRDVLMRLRSIRRDDGVGLSGCTITTAFRHPDHVRGRITQNSGSRSFSVGRFWFRLSTMSCWRRAVFSAFKCTTILSLQKIQRRQLGKILYINEPYTTKAVNSMIPMRTNDCEGQSTLLFADSNRTFQCLRGSVLDYSFAVFPEGQSLHASDVVEDFGRQQAARQAPPGLLLCLTTKSGGLFGLARRVFAYPCKHTPIPKTKEGQDPCTSTSGITAKLQSRRRMIQPVQAKLELIGPRAAPLKNLICTRSGGQPYGHARPFGGGVHASISRLIAKRIIIRNRPKSSAIQCKGCNTSAL